LSVAQHVVAEARDWIGTPYVHQASTKGAGTDCLGLLRGVWRAVLGAEPCAVPPYTADWDEASAGEILTAAAMRWLRQKSISDAIPGDVAKHLGIQSRVGLEPAFIHAYSRHAVLESPLSRPWARRIVGRFSFPEGAE
jgi:NlpC/P60 family putative phage cell wall peptidase